MELKEIYGLWDRFEQSTVTEMDLDFQGVHLHLKKEEASGLISPSAEERSQAVKKKVQENPVEEPDPSVKTVKAPMVGVFYQAPSPDAEPFIKPGQRVTKGDVIGIIEAMKCMNEITAQESGVVKEILVKDSELVEFDQVLLTLVPTGGKNV